MSIITRPAEADVDFCIGNAHIVAADAVFIGHVTVSGGAIVAIDTGAAPAGCIDFAGAYLLPGLVDIHTDHFEKHVFPRSHVRWNAMRALMAHDAQIIGSGITAVFDSLCVGAAGNSERREILAPMIDAIETAGARGMLRAEHFVHLRCEITDPQTPDLVAGQIDRPVARLVSIMEHVPGIRQSRDVDAWVMRMMKDSGRSESVVRSQMAETIARVAGIGETVRPQIVALARQRGLPLMSHDDTEVEHVAHAQADGVTICEFPCTIEAAQAARAAGMTIVAGAPNILRGGSQSGNIAVAELLAAECLDILASDYVPRSMLDSVFHLAAEAEFDIDLPAACRLVTLNPAQAAGLRDRGEIAVGKRADMICVDVTDGHPHLRQGWRAGRRVI